MTISVSSSPTASFAPASTGTVESAAPQAAGRHSVQSQSDAVVKVDTVNVSDRALAAHAMMTGATKAASGEGGAHIDQLTREVAGGTYLPAPAMVAAAIVQYERRAGKGTN